MQTWCFFKDRHVYWPKERVSMDDLFKMLQNQNQKSLQPFKWISRISDIYLTNLSIHINEKNGKGETIFHLASEVKDSRILSYIISKCKSINEKDSSGETPLHRAIRSGNTKNAKLLLEWGADVDSLTYSKETPLMYACRHIKNIDIVKLLLSHNANIELTNSEGEKALDICRNNTSTRTSVLQVLATLKNNDNENDIVKLLHPLYRQM